MAGGTYGYGHAVDELVEVLRDAVALELGGDGLRLGRGGTGSPSRLDVLALLLEVLVVSAPVLEAFGVPRW